MKKQTFYGFTVLALFLIFGSLPASAQSTEYAVRFQVPFDFQVKEKILPAGTYTISRDPKIPQRLLIHSPEQNVMVSVLTIPHALSKMPNRPNLIFRKYGEKRFLAEVRVVGREDGYELIKSKEEQSLTARTEVKNIRVMANDPGQSN